jgi:pimeloyl-ACP methyl ester carboxylesterase
VAGEYPDRLYSYTALSVPHITAFARSYREDDVQYKMSNYIRKFQTPLVVEYKLAKNNYAALKKIYSHHSQEEIDSYVNLFSRKGGLGAMLNWYRGNFSGFSEGFTIGNITVPTLFIWGNKDQAIARYGVELTKEYMKGPYRFIEINAGHWLIQEAYPSFSNEIVGHLKQYN